MSYDSSLNEANEAKKEREAFLEFVKSIDDNLFVELIEIMGSPLVNKLQDMINGDNLESVRAAVLRFKNEYKQLLSNKINYYQKCLGQLTK